MLLKRIVLPRDDANRSGGGKRYHFEYTYHELRGLQDLEPRGELTCPQAF
jgi:hypothetical protein